MAKRGGKGYRAMPRSAKQMPRARKKKVVRVEETVTVHQMMVEAGVDTKMVNRKIHICCLLADIMDGYFADVEEECRKVDKDSHLPIRRASKVVISNLHEIREIIDFTEYSMSGAFGELSDKLKEEIERMLKAEKKPVKELGINPEDLVGKTVEQTVKKNSGSSTSLSKRQGEVIDYTRGDDFVRVLFEGNKRKVKVPIRELTVLD